MKQNTYNQDTQQQHYIHMKQIQHINTQTTTTQRKTNTHSRKQNKHNHMHTDIIMINMT